LVGYRAQRAGVDRCGEEQPTNGRLYRFLRSGPMVGITDVSAADRWSRQGCRADRWSAIARSAQGFIVAVKSSRPTVGSTGVRAADQRLA